MPGEDASSQAPSANVGRVWYYPFARERITGLHEEEIDRYGCPFEVARDAFDRAVSSRRPDTPSYDSRDVRAKVVFGSETVFIDRFGAARRVGGEEFFVDTELFAAALVAAGSCPEVR